MELVLMKHMPSGWLLANSTKSAGNMKSFCTSTMSPTKT